MELKSSHILTIFQTLVFYDLLSCSSAMPEQSLAEKAEMFSQLSKLPLSKNPFFIKTLAMSGQFDGEGTEGMAPDFTGYSCRWVGNMECNPTFLFQCDGTGIVDCTGNCPGDEEAVGKMISMMEDKELIDEFPLLAQIKAEQGKDPEKAKAGKERFVQILKNCNYGGLVALVGLSDGIDFGGQKDSNDSLTFVDSDALSGFDYDYEEVDGGDKNATTEKSTDMDPMKLKEDGSKADMTKMDKGEAMPESSSTPEPDAMKDKKTTEKMMKADEAATTLIAQEEEVRLNNTIDSESRAKEFRQVPVMEQSNVARPLKNENSTPEENELKQLRAEVKGLREVFLEAIDIADGISNRRKRSANHPEMVSSLANKLKSIPKLFRRRIRSVAENMTDTTSGNATVTIEAEKCRVQNLSCVAFPNTTQCSGIAMGGCMSHRKLLASLFTPKVIMFVCGGILILVAVGFGLAVYVHKRKTTQSVEPAEGDNQDAIQKPT